MKIVHDSPDRLILRRRPWPLAVLLLFIAGTMCYVALLALARGNGRDALLVVPWAVIAGTVFTLYCQTDIAVFDRTSGEFRHTRRLLLWRRKTTIPLDRIRRARIEQSFGERVTRDAKFLRPVLDLLPEDTPPFRLVARTLQGQGARRATDAVNGWLRRRT